MNNVYPRNAYQTQETLFDKLESFGIEYIFEQAIFKNLAIFDFESICPQEKSLTDTVVTKWIGKHIPNAFSIYLNLLEEKILFYNSDPCYIVTSFIDALENSASQSKAILKNLLFDIETTEKIQLCSIMEKLAQRRIRREQAQIWMTAISRLVPLLNSCRVKSNS